MLGGLKLLASEHYVITIGAQSISLLDNISVVQMLVFSLVNSMLVPVIASLIGGFAKNKIEGFAFVILGGFLVMVPALTLIPAFTNSLQYVLGILPNFWALKAVLNEATNSYHQANLPFYGYMLIGAFYQILLMIASLRFLLKRTN